MSKINLCIIGEHHLMTDGISAILSTVTDFNILSSHATLGQLYQHMPVLPLHILIKTLHKMESKDIDEVTDIIHRFPKCNILVISYGENAETIYKIIRAGAKGFLAHDSSRQDLIEAVYSLRSGFDYFSKCITTILLNQYVQGLQKDSTNGLEKLSSREIEILTLWGNSCTNQEIADNLFISVRTVESHKTHIMQKLNLKTAVDLMKYAIRNNIIEL